MESKERTKEEENENEDFEISVCMPSEAALLTVE